jgi:hypothetical protein
MKVTNFGPDGLPITLAGWSTGITSLNSNVDIIGGGPAALNFVQRITSNTSNTLLNPIVNFASGTGVSLSATSNTLTITATGGAGGSTTAALVSIADAGSFFTASDVEAALQELASKDLGYQAHGNTGATETFSSLVGWHSATLDSATVTATFTGATSGLLAGMVLELAQDATGGRLVSWPAAVAWPGGTTPTLSTGAAAVDIFTFFSRDGGTTWYGFPTSAGTTSPLTTKGDLYTYSTVNIRLAVGSNGTGLYADSAETKGIRWTLQPIAGEILISDTPSTPLIFADLIQTDLQDDLVYADL